MSGNGKSGNETNGFPEVVSFKSQGVWISQIVYGEPNSFSNGCFSVSRFEKSEAERLVVERWEQSQKPKADSC